MEHKVNTHAGSTGYMRSLVRKTKACDNSLAKLEDMANSLPEFGDTTKYAWPTVPTIPYEDIEAYGTCNAHSTRIPVATQTVAHARRVRSFDNNDTEHSVDIRNVRPPNHNVENPNDTGTASIVGSWRDWANYVLIELRRLNKSIFDVADRMEATRVYEAERLENVKSTLSKAIECNKAYHEKAIGALEIEIAKLHIKAGVWGGIGALIPIIATILTALIVKMASG